MERGEGDGQNIGLHGLIVREASCGGVATQVHLRVEDEFWSLKKVKIPDSNNAVWLVHCRSILVVRGDA